MKNYNPKLVEKYVQKFWKVNKTFKSIDNLKKEKYYCLVMFPYPSGSLHIGHVRNYLIGDILSRFNRMNNKNVLYPIGWDAFGLPAEKASIDKKINAKDWTYSNINYMRKQLKLLGFSFDWDREIITCKKNYYIWEQLFFKKLYVNKLIYKKYYPVYWCNYDKTVLSNEQVINNNCWRCNKNISIKILNQWFIKITNYNNELLEGLNKLNWPFEVKKMQKNWIGKSIWYKSNFIIANILNIKLKIIYKNIEEFINIEYILITKHNNLFKKIKKYLISINYNFYKKDIIKHIKKYGYIKTNIFSINPLINRYIPIILLDDYYMIYIIYNKYFNSKNITNNFLNTKNYKKFYNNNKIKNIFISFYDYLNKCFCLNKSYNIKYNLVENNYIYKFFKYNIKDWCISRQRFWGVFIPIVKINKRNTLIPNNYLPIHFNNYNEINNFKIYINKKTAKIELNTLDTFFQSSWYYIRYTCPKYKKNMINIISSKYWLPIDHYIGGIEHSTMHLLYFRFYHKLLRDFNLINNDEPVKNLICQGMVLSKSYYYFDKNNNKIWINHNDVIKKNNNNEFYDKSGNKLKYNGLVKMSKSKNNGIDPNEIVKKYGSDTLRLFIIFSSPIKENLIWNESSIIGCYRFLNKIWNIINIHLKNKFKYINIKDNNLEILKITYTCIKNITYDIKKKNCFNISISYLMKLTNYLYLIINNKKYNYKLINNILSILLKMLYPFAPHISFMLWNKIGFSNIDFSEWPNYENYKNFDKFINYKIYLNNKFLINLKYNCKKYKKILKFVYKNINYKLLNNKKIFKIIFIKNKLINFLLN